jgi:iron complex transport system ATP-binding protein
MVNMVNMVTPPALTVDSVSFRYGAMPVLDEVTFSVARGEMVGLLGPNGAGKSTLLRLASGALKTTTGAISLHGRPIASYSRKELAKTVAVLPQDFSVQFAYTVEQVVALGRMPHLGAWNTETAADRAAVRRALDATNMGSFVGRVFNELSGGERQRVLLALALAQESEIVLLDEPTAHLDVKHQIETLEFLRARNRDHGVTVLAAMHDLNLASRYFPRLALLAGTLLADGSPAGVLTPGLLHRAYGAHLLVGSLAGDEHLSIVPSVALSPARISGVPPDDVGPAAGQ